MPQRNASQKLASAAAGPRVPLAPAIDKHQMSDIDNATLRALVARRKTMTTAEQFWFWPFLVSIVAGGIGLGVSGASYLWIFPLGGAMSLLFTGALAWRKRTRKRYGALLGLSPALTARVEREVLAPAFVAAVQQKTAGAPHPPHSLEACFARAEALLAEAQESS